MPPPLLLHRRLHTRLLHRLLHRLLLLNRCVDSIEYIRADKSKVTADLCNGKGVWLDKPCSKKDYDDVKCGEEIVVDVKTGSVTVKNKKDGNTLKSLC